MEKTAQKNIMMIYEDWRIFRKILKRDLALDRTWSAAYGVIWSALTKLPGPRAFRTVVMAAIAVVTASFFATIIIATRQVVGVSSPGDVVLILVVGDAGSSLDGSNGSFDSSDGYAES